MPAAISWLTLQRIAHTHSFKMSITSVNNRETNENYHELADTGAEVLKVQYFGPC